MFQELDLAGSRGWLGGDAQTVDCHDDQSLPFDQPGFAQLEPDQQRWLLEGFLCAQDVARFRLGQELHDSTGQLIVALRLTLARLKKPGGVLAPGDFFSEIGAIVEQIEKEMRAFSFLHYPTELQDAGLVVALGEFASGFGQRTGLKVTFRNHCRSELAQGSAAADFLRVEQEALTNVYRHAQATTVRISLALRRGRLELCIADDGQGLPDEAFSFRMGVGLRSMRHRMEIHGGRFVLQRLARGTKLIASVPAACIALKPH
jgi:signal transduction histidine kinase